MQVVQELKFVYDTNLDPEIDRAVNDLIHMIHEKACMIKEGVTPNRGGSTIVNRAGGPYDGVNTSKKFLGYDVGYDKGTDWPGKISYEPQPERKAYKVEDLPDDIRQAILETTVPDEKWDCGRKTGDTECDCQFPQNKSWDSINACQR